MVSLGLAVIASLNAAASVLQGATGVGDAIAMHIVWESLVKLPSFADSLHHTALGENDVMIVTLMSYIRVLVTCPLTMWLNRAVPFHWELFWALTIPQCVFGLLTLALMGGISMHALKLGFAVVMLLAAMTFGFMKIRNIQPMPFNSPETGRLDARAKRGAIVAGVGAGIAGSLFGVNGPPLMLFVLFFAVPPEIMRGTVTGTFFVSGVFRVVFAFSSGVVTKDMAVPLTVTLVFGVAGLYVGNAFAAGLSRPMFNGLILTFLCLASLSMLPLPAVVLQMSSLVAVAGLVALHFRLRVSSRRVSESGSAAASNASPDEPSGGRSPPPSPSSASDVSTGVATPDTVVEVFSANDSPNELSPKAVITDDTVCQERDGVAGTDLRCDPTGYLLESAHRFGDEADLCLASVQLLPADGVAIRISEATPSDSHQQSDSQTSCTTSHPVLTHILSSRINRDAVGDGVAALRVVTVPAGKQLEPTLMVPTSMISNIKNDAWNDIAMVAPADDVLHEDDEVSMP